MRKIYHLSFFIITHGAFNIADPSSMQDVCHNKLSKYDLACHESPSSSVVRAPTSVQEVMGAIPIGNSDFFLCPTLMTNWICHLSHFFPSLKFTIFLFLLSHMSDFFFNQYSIRVYIKRVVGCCWAKIQNVVQKKLSEDKDKYSVLVFPLLPFSAHPFPILTIFVMVAAVATEELIAWNLKWSMREY